MAVEQRTLHSNTGTSDKLYWAAIEPEGTGFVVNFAYGPRTGSMTSGCKTVDPKDKKKKKPVTLDKAKTIYEKLLAEKRDGSSHYHNYPECGHGQNGAAVSYSTPEPVTEAKGRDLDCQLFTELDDQTRAEALMRQPNIVVQQKMDGKRIRLLLEGLSVTGFNRKNKACGISQTIVTDGKRLDGIGPVLFDGETIGDTFWVFDLLECGGVDVRSYPFSERDKALVEVLGAAQLTYFRRVPTAYDVEGKDALYQRLKREKLEGIMLKRADAAYRSGRQRDQFKHKFTKTASFVVLKINERNSVQVGLFNNGQIVECGNCTIRSSEFQLKPGSVIEIKYLYAFPDSNHIYQPRMVAMRDDIRPEECLLSQLKYKGVQQ